MLPYAFSAMTVSAVGEAANKMIAEIKRQVEENPEILKLNHFPDYDKCI